MSNQPPTSNPGPSPQPQPRPVMGQPIPTPYYAYPPRRGSAVKTFFLILLIFCFLGSFLLNLTLMAHVAASRLGKVTEKYYSHKELGSKKIAIITVDGTILTGEGFIAEQIKQATNDEAVCGVVLRVNSPGGTVYGSDQILHALQKMKKERDIPVVVSMGGVAASGGYYISMIVGDEPDSIFAEPTTWTGSIGVKIPHYDLSELLQKWGVQEDTIASHELKTMGSFAKPMTPKERAIFQELVDDSFVQFKDIIKSGRPKFKKDSKALDLLATGQVFTAKQAMENGLVDKVGYLEDAVERAIELAGVTSSDVRVVEYEKIPSFFGSWVESRSPDTLAEFKTLLNINSPLAFYLFSWDE